MPVKFPRPLRPGDRIAVSAVSSGVGPTMQPRLALSLANLRARGFEVVEGRNLRNQYKSASANAKERAQEFEQFLLDDSIAAVFPPWGGDLAATVLGHIDWTRLSAASPKWILGFSDVSTFQVPLLLTAGWVSLHGANLMQLVPQQTDKLTSMIFEVLTCNARHEPVVQASSTRFERIGPDVQNEPGAPFVFNEVTQWKCLNFPTESVHVTGRLIGGCLDSLCSLVGTQYGAIPQFVADCGEDGAILFLENAELGPVALLRTLVCLRRNAWFDGLRGVIIGRSAAADACDSRELSYVDALSMALENLPIAVLYDADIGHLAPQMALMQGARATVIYEAGRAVIEQQWS